VTVLDVHIALVLLKKERTGKNGSYVIRVQENYIQSFMLARKITASEKSQEPNTVTHRLAL